MNHLQAAHMRCMEQLRDKVRYIPAKVYPGDKPWNPTVREGSIPHIVYEEIKKLGGDVDNEVLEKLPYERKYIIVALYALRKKKLIEGLGDWPFTKHRVRNATAEA